MTRQTEHPTRNRGLMTSQRAIRKHCLDCSSYSQKEARECAFHDCVLYEYRMGRRPAKRIRAPLKAIRKHCVGYCMLGSAREVELCPTRDCPLWPYRFGRKPTPEEAARYTGEGEPGVHIRKSGSGPAPRRSVKGGYRRDGGK